MASEQNGETSLSSSFFKEINGLPVIQVAGDIYSSTKKRYWLLNTGLMAAEQGLFGLFARVSCTLGIGQRVDELAGESVCRLKEKYPSLHQSPEELKSTASSSFRSVVRFAVKTPPGRLFVSGLDLVIGATDSAASLLNPRDERDRKCSPQPKDDKKMDELSEDEAEDTERRTLSDKNQQTSPAFPKSVIFNIRSYARDFLTYLVNRLKYVRRYMCGRKKRVGRGSQSMSPDKEREIESRRKVSPRKKVSASLLGRLTQMTLRLLGLDPTGRVGLNGSLVAGSVDAEKKRKHDEIVSEDGSDDDLANFDYDNNDSEDDPDYEVTTVTPCIMARQKPNQDTSWTQSQRNQDVNLSNYAGVYDTRCLEGACYQLKNTVQLQKGQNALEPRIETFEGFKLQTGHSRKSGKSQASATVTTPDTAIGKDAQGEKETTTNDIVENVNFLSAGSKDGSDETDPKVKTMSGKVNESVHKIIGISTENVILISDSEDIEDFNGEVIEVENDESEAEATAIVVSIDLTRGSELNISVVENEEMICGNTGNADSLNLDAVAKNVVFKCDFCEYTNVDPKQVHEHLVEDKHYRATPYELHSSGEIGRQHASLSPLTVEANMFKTILVVCPVCFKVFPDIGKCSFHFSKIHCSKFHSQHCYGLSPVKKEFVISLKNDLVCTVCKKTLRTTQAYINHCLDTRHLLWPGLGEGEEQIYICCRHKMDVFHDFNSLLCHLLSAHTKNTNCEFNVIVFKEPVRCLTFNVAEDRGLQQAKRNMESECAENGHSLKNLKSSVGSGSIDPVHRLPNNISVDVQTLNVFKCDYCPVTCLLNDNMQSHVNKEKHYSASLMSKDKYGNLQYLREPSVVKNPSALFSTIVVICPFNECDCVFENPRTCSQHYQLRHNQKSEPKYAISSVESSSWYTIRVSKDFTCSVCRTGFSKLKYLNAHIKTNCTFGKKPGLFTLLLCRECNYSTGSYRTLYRHIKKDCECTDEKNVEVLYVSKHKTHLSLPPFPPNQEGFVRSIKSEISELKSIKKTMGKNGLKRVNSKIRQLKSVCSEIDC